MSSVRRGYRFRADVNEISSEKEGLEDNYRCVLFEAFGLFLIQSIDQYNAHYCKDEACTECPPGQQWTSPAVSAVRIAPGPMLSVTTLGGLCSVMTRNGIKIRNVYGYS